MRNRRDFLKNGLLAFTATTIVPKEVYSAQLPSQETIKGHWIDTAKGDLGLNAAQTISITNLGTKGRTVIFYSGDIPLTKEDIEKGCGDSDYIIYGQGQHDRIRFRGIAQLFECVDLDPFNQIIIGDMIVRACCVKQASVLMGFTQISSVTGKSEGWQYLPLGDFIPIDQGKDSNEFSINGFNHVFNKQTLMTVEILSGCFIELTFVFPH
ncbi:MAG: hypothetical protein M1445_14890 [Bacteroidetes bacterium]|nr:hypothetical protein [Bacteroidota bacterium]MCL6102769.1 hypothetical protein [Bacteroidota bacterium]